MSLFTRRERNQQLGKGKLIRYFSYAIGEILLIVVGVLLAVKINTEVADSKNRAAIQTTYSQLFQDLGEDLKKAKQRLRHYARKDSLIYEVMNDRVTYDDYMEDSNLQLRTIVTSYQVLNIQDQSFKSLMALNDKVTLRQGELLDMVKQLYIDKKENVDRNNSYMTNMVIKNIDWMKLNTSWFSNFYFTEKPPTKVQIEFYQNSDVYRNLLAEYSQTGPGNHVQSVLSYYHFATQVHAEMGKFLAIGDTLLYDSKQYEQFIGEFTIEGNPLKVVSRDQSLYLQQEPYEERIIPLSSHCFTTADGGFYYLTTDSTDQVTGLEIRYGGERYNLQKR